MKKTLLSIALIFFIAKAYSQVVPNNSFENWQSFSLYEEPVNWTSYNSQAPSYPVTVTKSTSACMGNFSMQIQNMHFINTITGLDDTLQGVAVSGTDLIAGAIGFPFPYRAQNMTVCYKYTRVAPDSAELNIKFTKYNSTSHLTQDVSTNFCYKRIGGTTTTFTTATVPITFIGTFPSPNTPDTAIISFSPSSFNTGASVNAGSTLWVDNVIINTNVGEIEVYNSRHAVRTYPNPAKSEVHFSNLPPDASHIRVLDIIGNEIGNFSAETSPVIFNVKDLSTGIYIYEVLSSENKTVASGKFNVAE